MKKITSKRRKRDAWIAYLHRTSNSRSHKRNRRRKIINDEFLQLNAWIQQKSQEGLNITVRGTKVMLTLPETMNFSNHYELTTLYLTAIRKLAEKKRKSKDVFKLAAVYFDDLVELSTSAALVLTAEISKWDDSVRSKLAFDLNRWNPQIARQLYDLGYFDLFKNNPFKGLGKDINYFYDVKLVPYIKGKCGDSNKARILKKGIREIVGEDVNKWTFLHSGLTEAVTNVTHHAYPDEGKFSRRDKNWYLSGSFDEKQKVLKIVFYDQGIGIPKSLPASKVWEKALVILSKIPIIDRKKDEVLLKAAVEMDRTSTGTNDRGKGLQDLLEFVKQRDNGYLSIISHKGLYKYSMKRGREKVKSVSFERSLLGTLIIWNVVLEQ
jgi:hypothetical protein